MLQALYSYLLTIKKKHVAGQAVDGVNHEILLAKFHFIELKEQVQFGSNTNRQTT